MATSDRGEGMGLLLALPLLVAAGGVLLVLAVIGALVVLPALPRTFAGRVGGILVFVLAPMVLAVVVGVGVWRKVR